MYSSNEDKEQLREILEQQEYQAYEQDSSRFTDRLLDVIADWLMEAFNTFFPNWEVTESNVHGLIYFIGFFGLGLLIFFLVKLSGNLSGEKERRGQGTFASSVSLEWSTDKHWREADELAAHGNLTEAARHVFLGMLLAFDEKGWVDTKAWKTNGDYHRELAGVQQEMGDAFGKLALTFDQITYGNRTMYESEYEQFRQKAFTWLDEEGGYD
ncbi:DUF4129 domain-containing protein [Halobacillus litoralis]|uniref:DUF4129 domain-containing protein n=1 Tax=Halobacillus litoralis TaxID=45668 RepID=UPI00248FEE95|nr:DUF4129 domain-containing protein [Halobacillus litoralis]